MSVERLARALGVWSDGAAVVLVGLARKHGAALIKVMDSDGFRVWTPTTRTGLDQHWRLYVDPHDIDEGTALMFLLALAAELRLDVGRCPACVGSKLKGGPSDVEGLDTRPDRLLCPECSEPGPPVDCEVCEGRGQRSDSTDLLSDDAVAMFASRATARVWCRAQGFPISLVCRHNIDGRVQQRHPWAISTYTRGLGPLLCWSEIHHRPDQIVGIGRVCPKCEGAGRQPVPPTGRLILGAEAILDTMPRELPERGLGKFAARLTGNDLLGRTHGDKATRDALAVRADKLQAKGDLFGELLALWLRGVCPECEGSGEEPEPSVLPPADSPVTSALCRTKVRPARRGDAGWPGIRDWIEVDTSCLKCHGRGTLLGAEWAALESLAELWCGRLECDVCTFGGLRTSWQTELCECGGTGRKKISCTNASDYGKG